MIETDDNNPYANVAAACQALREQLARRIVGQDEVLRQVLVGLLAGGHSLLVGVPGLAKTMMVRSLARALRLPFARIQFTPDLMPADITGTEVIQEEDGQRSFRFLPGPIFASVLLADEINRSPPKTQSALLEAMQEDQVTVAGKCHPLPSPFFVLATQNPIEQEGTYPLPEAQLDRFMMQINVGYMNQADETRVVLQTTEEHEETIDPILTAETLLAISGAVRRVALAPNVAEYATRIVRATRPPQPSASTPLTSDQSSAETPSPEIVQKYVQWGSGPRGAQSLVLAAKANAAMDGRAMVQRNDIDTMLLPVLRHRVRMGFSARADGVSVDQLLMEVLRTVQQEEKEQHEQSSKASGMGDVVRPTNPA